MRSQTRDRFLLPVLLPVGILVAIGLVLWGFSRLLLGAPGAAATVVAVVVATAVLVVAALAAARPQVRGSTIGAMVGATAGIAMVAGGIALAVVAGGEDEEEPGGDGGPGAVVDIVAANIAFEPTNLTVPAATPFTIAFDNRDAGVQHNVAIFDAPDFSGTALFDGELVTGPIQVEYPVDPLEAGTYFFQCIVHPAMTGEMEAAGGGGGGDGGGGGGVTVLAQNVAFDTDTIELPAEVPSKITLDNQDAGVPHNISIYSNPELAETLVQGELVTGPAVVEVPVPPLPAGEYYFQCDVHPNMNGAVIAAAGAGEPGAAGSAGATGQTGET